MAEKYFVTLDRIIDNNSLDVVYTPEPVNEIKIETNEINRPGIVLTGYVDFFDPLRIQVLGWTELGFLQHMATAERNKALGYWLELHPAAAVVTRGLEIPDYLIKACEDYKVPLLSTGEETSPFIASLLGFLNRQLAPRITRHGVLMEVCGEGMLILGESGVGKSETAVELIKRGHRLVADDAVEIRKVSNISLVGSSPENIRHFLELRGIGIVNARRLFGMGSVKVTEKIDLIVELEPWDTEKVYDRMGVDMNYTSILGVKVPVVTIPVKPGRNLAVILEVAAMNNRQKKMGYNAAQELLDSLGLESDKKEVIKKWDIY